MSDALRGAKALVAGISEKLRAFEGPREVDAAVQPLAGMGGALRNLERRLDEGPDAPLRVAFFGPTGAGKSKLFTGILGEDVSPAGFRRPFTLHPVYSVHADHGALAPRLRGETKWRRGDSWRDIIFIDTPDFDSVEHGNREEADRIFGEAEAFVFVVDSQKYADQATWDYLERVFRERKPTVLVLNKVTGDTARLDYERRLAERFGRVEVTSVREHAVDDRTPLPASDPALAEIAGRIRKLAGGEGERRAALAAGLRADLEVALDSWARAASALRGYIDGASALRGRAVERARKVLDGFDAELSSGMDAELRNEVHSRVLERIRRIDILRYPRKLLALPFEGIRHLAGRWWPSRASSRPSGRHEAAAGGAFHALEARLLAFAEATIEDAAGEPRCPGILGQDAGRGLRLHHAELDSLYTAREKAFREWLGKEASETASRLTLENKAKFILSQVIYNCIVVGVQVHTAGHFTLVELATDGVLSPLVAKAVGIAVSNDRVREFERTARAERSRFLEGVVEEARGRFLSRFDDAVAWAPAFEALARDVEGLHAGRGDLLREFEVAGRVLR